MYNRLKAIEDRYEQIAEMLTDMAVISDIKRLTELSKEQRSIEKTVVKYRELLALEAQVAELKELVKEQDRISSTWEI